MRIANRRAPLTATCVATCILAACGGGGGDSSTTASQSTGTTTTAPAPSPAPAPAPAPATLNDPANAVRLAAAMTQASWVAGTLTPTKWTGSAYKVRSRTDLNGCLTSVYTNADGIPGAGDKLEQRLVNCSASSSAGSYTFNRQLLLTLNEASNGQLPDLGAWTATETLSVTGTSVWDLQLTSTIRSKGDSTLTVANTQTITHQADGRQQDSVQGIRITAKGTQDGAPFDYVIDMSFVCNFASGQSAGTCVNGPSTLKGTLNGAPADATLTQTGANPAQFDITQAGQTIRVSKNLTTGVYTITTANGQVQSGDVNFELSARY